MKQRTEIQRSFSAYWFSLVITVAICALLTGIIYIDCCAGDTILSADGVIYPLFDKALDTAERIFRM